MKVRFKDDKTAELSNALKAASCVPFLAKTRALQMK